VSNSTADIARSVITSGDTTNNDSNTTSNAHEHSQIAEAEMDALAAGGIGPNTHTKRVAAAMTVFHDRRPYVSTRQGAVRRQFDDDADLVGSASTASTRRAAREAVDGVTFFDGVKANPGDKTKLAANEFAADVNSSTLESTLPTNATTDQIVAEIIRRRRER
jgi:hypothetical protein